MNAGPDAVDGELAQAIEHHQAGRLAEAMRAYQRVLVADERHPIALNNLSLMLDDATAVQLLQAALDIAPEYLDALVNMSTRWMALANPQEARKYAERAQRVAPEDARVGQLLSRLEAMAAAQDTALNREPPAYTVIIPTHRRAKLLTRALASIQQQASAARHEVIVVSDAEDAATDEVCRQWLARSDTYIRRAGPPGPSASRNLALQIASGRTILFLDDDDAWHPGLLAALDECEALQKGQSVYFDASVVKETRKPEGPELLSEERLDTRAQLTAEVFVKNQLHMSCLAFPRERIQGLTFDVHMRAYEDWDFLLSAFERGMPVHVPILGSQIHEVDDASTDRRGSSTSATDANALIDYLYVYRRHPVAPALQEKRAALLAHAGLSLPQELL